MINKNPYLTLLELIASSRILFILHIPPGFFDPPLGREWMIVSSIRHIRLPVPHGLIVSCPPVRVVWHGVSGVPPGVVGLAAGQ